MGRAPCCDRANVKRGPWSPEEDRTLKNYVETHGTGGNWIALPQKAGLRRCGKSCRLRWLNYLRPGIKHGDFTEQEDNIICSLYKSIGSRWSVIASHLPGRTDNDVKNYWNTKLKKKLQTALSGLSPQNQNSNKRKNNDNNVKQTREAIPIPPPTLVETGGRATVKSEDYGFGTFSMPSAKPTLSSSAPVDAGTLGCFNPHFHGLVTEPASFPAPELAADGSTFGGGTTTNGYMVSPSPQDISAASSCLTTENSIGWPDQAGSGVDALLMELGLEPMDMFDVGGPFDRWDVGHSLQVGTPRLWADTVNKTHEFYQGVTYS